MLYNTCDELDATIEARNFYREVLGCSEGRSDTHWVDFNLYGHQFVCHLNPALGSSGKIAALYNPVDAHSVPVPHCGVVLDLAAWSDLKDIAGQLFAT